MWGEETFNLPLTCFSHTVALLHGKSSRQKETARSGGESEVHMRFHKGLWYYRGTAYSTLRAALLAVWPLGVGK